MSDVTATQVGADLVCDIKTESTGSHLLRVCAHNGKVVVFILDEKTLVGKYRALSKQHALKMMWLMFLAVLGIDP